MRPPLDPSHIMQTATGFWPSKVLLTAVGMDLFSTLGDRALTARELGGALTLHPRGTFDFFDALVALGFLRASTASGAISTRRSGPGSRRTR
jgi:hypothetical protein